MGIENTRTGDIFYRNVPQMVGSLEKISRSLEKIAERLETPAGPDNKTEDFFMWANFSTSKEVLDDAAAIAANDDDLDRGIFEMIADEITDDSDKRASKLISCYRVMKPEEKRAVDSLFVEMCGWSLTTLIEQYVAKNEPDEAAWKSDCGYIHLRRENSRADDRVRYDACLPDSAIYQWGYAGDDETPLSRIRDQVCRRLGWTGGEWEKIPVDEIKEKAKKEGRPCT